MLILSSVAGAALARIVPLLPKPPEQCRIVCIPTAANVEDGDKQWLQDELRTFAQAGFTLDMLDLAGGALQDIHQLIAQADIVYVTGGNTYYLLEQMHRCDFETHVRAFLKRGGVYIGSSAGSIVASPDIAYVGAMDDAGKAPSLKGTRGLHLTDLYPIVHRDHPAFRKAAAQALADMQEKNLPAIALNDDQAVVIDGDESRII